MTKSQCKYRFMNRICNHILLILFTFAFFIGLLAAQQERQAATWKLATVDKDKIVHCTEAGWTCATNSNKSAKVVYLDCSSIGNK